MVLYRKYRPKKFSEVIGQEKIINILKNEIKQNRLAHAYLFTGPRGLGKTTTARLLAKSLNCLNRKPGKYEPCNKCNHCKSLNNGNFLDLIELDAASQTGVDNIRKNVISHSNIPPRSGQYKIFVIDEAHMLSNAAFNALLKTLEEPPEYAIFILATTEFHKLPETIVSRCQRFDFTKVSLRKIVKRLKEIAKKEKIEVDENILKMIAYRSEGCVRDAESLLSQLFAIGDKKISLNKASLVIPPTQTGKVVSLLSNIFNKDKDKAIKVINEVLDKGGSLEQFLSDTIDFLRKVIFSKIGLENENLQWQIDEKVEKQIKDFAKEDMDSLIQATESFVNLQTRPNYEKIPQLLLELNIIKICNKL
ncbi:MAG TPA: DNA polymerase III subunit gamma/tau [Patescibacteria group bacterium]|nr:DNA polymerase III subunit gamma/tau [Patescibacteria group bacterium]